MTDQAQVIPTARRLMGLRAFKGAATVLFTAALQREAAEVRDARQWSPTGMIPLRSRQPAEHLHASNDHLPASNLTA